MADITQIADGLHRVKDGLVNFYVVEDGDEVAVVDAGWPRSWPVVQEALTQIGRRPEDLGTVLLTHGHPDHLGAAEKARAAVGATVHAFRGEADRVKGGAGTPIKMVPGLVPTLYRGSAIGFTVQATVRGFLFPRWVEEVTPFDAETLDLPGRPTVLPTPGHTEGHVSFLFADKGALVTGDALATYNPLTGNTGPQLLPKAVTEDLAQARASLDVLAAVEADVLLPGHGEPLRGRPADAVDQAR